MTDQIVLLVDGDNLASHHADRLLAIARAQRPEPQCASPGPRPLATRPLAHVYCNAQKAGGWHDQPAFRMIHAGCGKNAADILLALDAMEMLLTRGLRHFIIASSDGDFRQLALRLREHGATVIGAGEAKAPDAFAAACSGFLRLAPPIPQTAPAPQPKPRAPAPELPVNQPAQVSVQASAQAAAQRAETRPVTDFDRKIRSLIAAHSKQGLGMGIADLGRLMRQQHGVKISEHKPGTWRGYLAARPALFDLDPKGPEARARFIPAGFAATG